MWRHAGHAEKLTVWHSQIKWFERRVNLELATKGIEESEKEVFELEDTGEAYEPCGFSILPDWLIQPFHADVNPIGCISGKCYILRAANYEEVSALDP